MNISKEPSTVSDSGPPPNSLARVFVKSVGLLAVGCVIFFAYQNFGDSLKLENLASKESELRQYQANNPILVYGVAFLIYVAVTGLSLPGATIMTLVFGWYFGFARGLFLVSFASVAGATVAFLLSRVFLRDTIQNKFRGRLASFNESLARDGAFYLFTLRLIPVVPFFVINVVMGLTPLKTWTFWWVSQLGMFPATAVFVYAGSQFPDLKTLAVKGPSGILTPQLIGAFVVLGLFPFVIKKLMIKIQAATHSSS